MNGFPTMRVALMQTADAILKGSISVPSGSFNTATQIHVINDTLETAVIKSCEGNDYRLGDGLATKDLRDMVIPGYAQGRDNHNRTPFSVPRLTYEDAFHNADWDHARMALVCGDGVGDVGSSSIKTNYWAHLGGGDVLSSAERFILLYSNAKDEQLLEALQNALVNDHPLFMEAMVYAVTNNLQPLADHITSIRQSACETEIGKQSFDIILELLLQRAEAKSLSGHPDPIEFTGGIAMLAGLVGY